MRPVKRRDTTPALKHAFSATFPVASNGVAFDGARLAAKKRKGGEAVDLCRWGLFSRFVNKFKIHGFAGIVHAFICHEILDRVDNYENKKKI